jgi:hypothetical protein
MYSFSDEAGEFITTHLPQKLLASYQVYAPKEIAEVDQLLYQASITLHYLNHYTPYFGYESSANGEITKDAVVFDLT